MRYMSPVVSYKKMNPDSKYYIGYTIQDCQLIDHFLGNPANGNWHNGIFYEDILYKLELVASLHNCLLQEVV